MTPSPAAPQALGAPLQLLVFRLAGQRQAVPLANVESVIHAVEVTPLPGAPPPVCGVINAGGRILPVFCLRRRFAMALQDVTPAHQFLLVRAGKRTLALVIDEAQAVVDCPPGRVEREAAAVPGIEQFAGVARLDDGLLLIHDMAQLLSLPDERALDLALERHR